MIRFVLLLAIILSASNLSNAGQPVFDSDQAFEYLVKQCSFGPRNPGSPGHQNCLDWIVSTLKEQTEEVYLQDFEGNNPVSGEKYHLTNVIARFESTNTAPLMLCAHWDTRPWADMDRDKSKHNTPILGANDGASGVAVLLELAAIFADHPPPRTILLAFWDGEDFGQAHQPEEFAQGSKYWAKNPMPEVPLEAILLDLVGDADLEIEREYYSARNAKYLLDALFELADLMNLPAFVNRPGVAVQDDHLPLQAIGIKAVDLIDFDYPSWHTMADTPDQCSAESLDQVGRLLVAFIYGR